MFARDEPRRRRRRSTDDSMSDSDNDDTTPLINPVDQTNSHGTFQPSAPPHEEGDPSKQNFTLNYDIFLHRKCIHSNFVLELTFRCIESAATF